MRVGERMAWRSVDARLGVILFRSKTSLGSSLSVIEQEHISFWRVPLTVRPVWRRLKFAMRMFVALIAQYCTVRASNRAICSPLEVEDYGLQASPEVSPPKWHLAHTTWFFEQFLLVPFLATYRVFHPDYAHLFNSYYEAVGNFFPRAQRGLLSRPTVSEVMRYRRTSIDAIIDLHERPGRVTGGKFTPGARLGLNHEQQHQELLLTDIKYSFSLNPLRPVYRRASRRDPAKQTALAWVDVGAAIEEIGLRGQRRSPIDNEMPRHRAYLDLQSGFSSGHQGEFWLSSKMTAIAEPDLWLSDGWATVRQRGWQAPLLLGTNRRRWWQFTLSGLCEGRWSDAGVPRQLLRGRCLRPLGRHGVCRPKPSGKPSQRGADAGGNFA